MAALKRELARVKKERFFLKEAAVLHERIEMKYRMVKRCRNDFPVKMMCNHLGVSVSGYYNWRGRKPSQRTIDNDRLFKRIQTIHAEVMASWVHHVSGKICVMRVKPVA